ncbi:hypothetical protein CCAX7_27400 [Capsulimonas corticalis]|uniref:Uncharacterized protein n=1 Tax=Capsulimonas corticalis TaxID=2219043 RepID=A0A402CTM8_9BACT|nr:PRC-barrel domain-containing protein [Capsulimonas corticalis]BDI30689.1 hypothetical protein CCAX7_27400 [Capsulimonas corticalis]
MTQTQTFNEQQRTGAPAILELLSELEKRDQDSKGAIQAGSTAGTGFADPRGFTVVNPTGHDVGKVDDLYVDPHTRQPFYALLALGNHPLGIGDRRVLVSYDDITSDSDKKARVKVAGL